MDKKQVSKLINGLYLVGWKSGGMSLAAVGRLADGSPWIAPINWQNDGDHFRAPSGKIWDKVSYVRMLHSQKDLENEIVALKKSKNISDR